MGRGGERRIILLVPLVHASRYNGGNLRNALAPLVSLVKKVPLYPCPI